MIWKPTQVLLQSYMTAIHRNSFLLKKMNFYSVSSTAFSFFSLFGFPLSSISRNISFQTRNLQLLSAAYTVDTFRYMAFGNQDRTRTPVNVKWKLSLTPPTTFSTLCFSLTGRNNHRESKGIQNDNTPSTFTISKISSWIEGRIRLSEEVKAALHYEKALVVLESTIITHGLPFPHNIQTALEIEETVRKHGAIPATIAVLDGHICIGLSQNEMEWLASKGSSLVKISRRDLPYVLSQGLSGGTTVSGTMIAAHKVGIPIFATGGIGGVHRGVEESMDVSADLRELGRTPVAVVAAGAKSILDISRTLEYLETEGVCVVTYGMGKDFPAFFLPRSGYCAPYNISSPVAAASIIDANLHMQLETGILFAVPIPEEFAPYGEVIEKAIQEAVTAAKNAGITGKDVTPFILQQVNNITCGASLMANIALVQNNARVASEIAVALMHKKRAWIEQDNSINTNSSMRFASLKENMLKNDFKKPVVIGGTVIDISAKIGEKSIETFGATYHAKMHQSFGGVGRNIADCMSRLGSNPLFVSVLGDDVHASVFISTNKHMDLSAVRQLKGHSTPIYCPVFTSSGHLLFGVGDMEVHSLFVPEMINEYKNMIVQAPIVCVDGNFSAAVIASVCDLCQEAKVPVWFEPTDVHKAMKPFLTNAWQKLTYISPNINEMGHMWSALTGKPHQTLSMNASVDEILKYTAKYCMDMLFHIPVIITTLGKYGLLLGTKSQNGEQDVSLVYYHSTPSGKEPECIVNVSGAGDCLNAAIIHFLIQGHELDFCIKAGLMAAQFSLQSQDAVPFSISADEFTVEKIQKWGLVDATNVSDIV